ncbi:MAG: c-type cytochrome domain-containing protein [Verrucomicrobiota bacterium]|nr:c-type cytochrome domain-containing protein [Verrucomicrobiota bacterium]
MRPVLSTHCFECHGHKAKGGLKLDSREATLAEGRQWAGVGVG